MVQRVLRLGDRTFKSLMTPRTDICWLDVEESLDENLQEILQSTYVLLPVGKGSLDVFAELIHRDIFSVWQEVRDHTLAGCVMQVLQRVSREADHFE
jgi:CBS domain containing-hemolysin-like protein